jgi:predicted DNA-binding transcriptional regulator AlpA
MVLIDTDDLVDLAETAALIGLDNQRGVSVYRRRYDDFPSPVVHKGRCVLWRRQDVEAWARGRGRDTTVTRGAVEPGRRPVSDSE